MSSAATHAPKGLATRMLQLVGLASCFLLLWAAARVAPHPSAVAEIAAIGLFLTGGTLAGELLEPLRVPHLTAYLAVGIVAGPYVLHVVGHESVESLRSVNGLALALIALSGGAELRFDVLKKAARSLLWATATQCFLILFAMAAFFMLIIPLIPFAREASLTTKVGIACLWGVVSITRSPSACLGVLSQTRARGPLATFSLAYVMLSDVVVIILAAVVITLVKPLVDSAGGFSTRALAHLTQEIIGSVALGTSMGLLIVAYLRWVQKNFIVVLVVLGFGFTEVIKYLGFEPLLTFLMAGFLVQNLSKQGERLVHAIDDIASVVYVLFFAIAGADLDIPLLQRLWPVALMLFAGRGVLTVFANWLSTRLADDPPVLRRFGWTSLISQAGVALGIAATIVVAFPAFGAGFRALAIAHIALNEMIGPVLFKLSLDVTGESSQAPEAERLSTA